MDSELLLQLYNKQAKMIYYYLKKNGCSHEDAEDIVQESYMRYIAYSSGVSSSKALSYIFSIAMNELKKVLKKKGKEHVISINDDRFWNNYANDLYLAIKKCTKWQLNMHATCHFKLLMQ